MLVLMLCMRHVNTKYTVNATAFQIYSKILSLKYVFFPMCHKTKGGQSALAYKTLQMLKKKSEKLMRVKS